MECLPFGLHIIEICDGSGEIGLEKEKIDRISELSRKSRSVGLTKEERCEQKALREEYLAAIRKNFRAQLENVEFVDGKKS